MCPIDRFAIFWTTCGLRGLLCRTTCAVGWDASTYRDSPVACQLTAASILFLGMALSYVHTYPTSNSEVLGFSHRSRKYSMDPDASHRRAPRSRTSFVKAHYHPFLFATMAFSAMAELGLTAFLVCAGNEHHTWPSSRYHSLLILFVFNAVWTTLFSTAYMMWIVDGASHLLASIASSVIWLMITAILWVCSCRLSYESNSDFMDQGTAAGVMHNTRTGGNCSGRPTISRSVMIEFSSFYDQGLLKCESRCRQSLTVEALGWTEFGLSMLTLFATCLWVHKRSSFHSV